MRARAIGVALLLAALAAYLGGARVLQRRAAAARDEYRSLRAQRRDALARLAQLERQDAFRRRAESVLAAGTGSVTPRLVRRAVVASLGDAEVSGVRLGVQAGRAPVAASVHLSAQGDFSEVVRLAGHLVRPGTGLVLERVRFVPRPPRVALELDAVGPGNGR